MIQQFDNMMQLKGISLADLNTALFLPLYNDSEWTSRRLAVEAVRKNVVVYRCIEEITRAATDIKIIPQLNGEDIPENSNDDMMRLFREPAPGLSFSYFLRDLLASRLYSGNGYVLGYDTRIDAVGNVTQAEDMPKRMPTELRVLRPYEMAVKTKRNNDYVLDAYEFRPDEAQTITRFPVDPMTGRSRICHTHTFNPNHPHLGLSPLEAAGYNIKIHNFGSEWNISLLENSCSPSGVYSTDSSMTNEGFSRFTEQIKRFFSGRKNAGRAMVLEEGLKFQQVGMSPKDMDFISSLDTSARNIASALGVPFALILPESSTYNNQSDARVSLYENTVVPLLSDVLDSLGAWFSAISGRKYTFKIDMDSISALEEKRAVRVTRLVELKNSGILTANEVREELGYEEMPELDNPDPQPVEDPNMQADAMKRIQDMYDKCRKI